MSQGTGTVWHRPGGGKQPGAWGAPPSVCTDGRMQSWAQQEVSQGQLTWPVTPGRSPVLLGSTVRGGRIGGARKHSKDPTQGRKSRDKSATFSG